MEYIGYCLKCKKQVKITDLVFSKQNSRNKLYIYIGKCEFCGSKVVKLLKNKI